MAKDIVFNDDARLKIKGGIDTLAEAVKMTLGPRGRAVVVEKSFGAPMVTFDGVTVAKEVELEDKYENLGADFIKQAADRTNDVVGDGTTTSVVLAQAMIDAGEKAISAKGFNVIQLAEELKRATEGVIAKLEDQKEEINDSQKVKEVATLSAKDAEMGSLIAEVMEKVGKEGVVTIEDSNTLGHSYELVEGMQFARGYVSPYMITNQERMEAALDDPYVLVTDQKISSIKDLLPLLEKIMQGGKKELVIIADDIDGEALATLVLNKIRGIVNVLAIKAPGFGDKKKEMLEDIAIVTGATFMTGDLGSKLENAELTDLGTAHRIVSTKDSTTIVDGKGKKEAIGERVSQIKAQIKASDSSYAIDQLKERLGKLSGGVAVLKIGAPTESAQKELKQRTEDAVAATRAAMEQGIVPGGGMALLNVRNTLPAAEKNEVAQAAHDILVYALEAPIHAIIAGSGQSADKVTELQKAKKKNDDPWYGYNAMTNEMANLKEDGIVDPLKVTKTAFRNALSVAANYLMIGAAMTVIPSKEEPMATPGGMPGMGGF